MVLFLISFLPVHIVFAEDLNSNLNSETGRISSNSKIHPMLLKWQLSDNPTEFAKNNGMLYEENTVQVYIYLTNQEFLNQISSEVNIVSSDQNIAVAYVNSKQLDQLETLDYVERVTLPDLARTPPIPQIMPKNQTLEKDLPNFNLFGVIVITIIGIITIVIFLRKKAKIGNHRE